jgi:hypothetical protein
VPNPSGSRKLKPQGGIKDSRGRAQKANVDIADIADAVGSRYESAARAEVEESMLCEMSFADLV